MPFCPAGLAKEKGSGIMADMTKIYIAIAAVIIVLGGVLYMLGRGTPNSQNPEPSQDQNPVGVATTTYSGSTFSIVYPVDFTVDPAFSNEEVNPAKPISGVRFTVPGTMATSTNLAADSFLSVEWLPRAKNCTGDIYLRDNVKPVEMSDGMAMYSMASTSGSAAGSSYEEMVYAIKGSSPCTAVRYFIHYSDLGSFTPGTAAEFDKAKLMSIFDDMRRSLILTASAAAPESPATPASPDETIQQ